MLIDFIRRAQPDEGPEMLLVGDMEILILFLGADFLGLARVSRLDVSQATNDTRHNGNHGSGHRSMERWNSRYPRRYFCLAALCTRL
jgi:hypothetical protein